MNKCFQMAMKLCFSPCGPDQLSNDDVMSLMTPKIKQNLGSLFNDDSGLKLNGRKVNKNTYTYYK